MYSYEAFVDPRPYFDLLTKAARRDHRFRNPIVGGPGAARTLLGIQAQQERQDWARIQRRGWRVGDSGRAELFGPLPCAPFSATPQASTGGWTGRPPVACNAYNPLYDSKDPMLIGGWAPRISYHLDC